MPIKPHMESDVDSLTRELCEKLKRRNGEIRAEFARNLETIAALERRLNLEPTQSSLSDMVVGPIAEKKNRKERVSAAVTTAAYKPNVFFGLTQRAAAIKLLRMSGQPMPINDILGVLQRSGFTFKAASPYRVLWKTLGEATEIHKQGSLFGLKEWRENGHSQTEHHMPADEMVDFQRSNDEPESGDTTTKE